MHDDDDNNMAVASLGGVPVKREAPSCSKMKRLCRLLDMPLYQAVGLLELLWHLTAREAPRGDIGKLSNEDIALAVDYRQDEDKLIETLVRTRWLDVSAEHRLIVHDWHEHADEAVKKRLTRSGQTFITARRVETKPPSVETKPQNGNLPRAGAGPVPEPEPHPGPEPEPGLSPSPTAQAQSTDVDPAPLLSGIENKQQPAKKRTPQDYVDFWNKERGPLAEVLKLTSKRRKHLVARIAEGLTPGEFKNIVAKIHASPFLLGDNERRWRVDFDFVIENEDNWTKILGGKYDRAEKPKPVRIDMTLKNMMWRR